MSSTSIIINGGRGGSGARGSNRGGTGGAGKGPKVTLKTYHIGRASFDIREPPTPAWTADFHAVKLADLILDEEIHKEEVSVDADDPSSRVRGVVQRRSHVVRVKDRVLNAQQFRHPLLAQLFGVHCSTSLNALVYHDEMMTIDQVKEMHSHSVLAWNYLRFAVPVADSRRVSLQDSRNIT
ncbi:hypothetical protein FB45DRAFT_933237 [Roridomyces roridus]|uniref:Uncharacterized protein n=1 Tax=Roridomyces roridus TaxID=1738132 RepID=A0AAD7BEH1_9AGAR|nr:hypothetical protein FB45DRAFT_933237 [Roridomyces roridus]